MIEKTIINLKYWTNFLGLGRSMLALCTLVNILFSKNNYVFLGLPSKFDYSNIEYYNIFYIFKDNLIFAKIISIIILISVLSGYFPRITAALHWWVTYSFFTSSFTVEGGDQVASILTFLLIPILLLDKRKNHWQEDFHYHSFYSKTIAFFVYSLIILQISIIYFNASIGKLNVEEWANGTAVYYWLNDTVFGLNYTLLKMINPLLKSPIFVTILTWGAIGIELALAFAIFGLKQKKLSIIFVSIGFLLHLSFAICFGLISFFFAMFGALILYLLAVNNNFNFKKYGTPRI